MRIANDRKIQIARGESLTLRGSRADLSLVNGDAPGGSEIVVNAPTRGRSLWVRAFLSTSGEVSVTSSTGQLWTTALLPGINLFEFVVEPEPDEWYCENDDGNPSHPVSKSDSICIYCGGKVIHGGK